MDYKRAMKACSRGEYIREAAMPKQWYIYHVKATGEFVLVTAFDNRYEFEPTEYQLQSNEWSIIDPRS